MAPFVYLKVVVGQLSIADKNPFTAVWTHPVTIGPVTVLCDCKLLEHVIQIRHVCFRNSIGGRR